MLRRTIPRINHPSSLAWVVRPQRWTRPAWQPILGINETLTLETVMDVGSGCVAASLAGGPVGGVA